MEIPQSARGLDDVSGRRADSPISSGVLAGHDGALTKNPTRASPVSFRYFSSGRVSGLLAPVLAMGGTLLGSLATGSLSA